MINYLNHNLDSSAPKIILIYLMLISAFGPYVFMSFGVRLEHLIIYSMVIYIVFGNNLHIRNHRSVLLILLPLVVLICVPFIGYAFWDKTISHTLAISQLENYIQPFALSLICFSICCNRNYYQIEECLYHTLRIFVVLMGIHTLVSIFMLLYPDLSFWRLFTGQNVITELSYETTMNAAELARSAGRSSGVFTQVFEAGYAYAIALISWAYLSEKYGNFSRYKDIILLSIVIGGVLTYSKVFIVLGVFFFCFLLNKRKLIKYLLAAFGLLVFIYFVGLDMGLFEKGFIYIKRLIFIDSNSSIFDIYTASRFSDESIIFTSISDVVSHSPVFGYGYGSIKTSDFALNEVIVIGGFIGLAAYLSLFCILLHLYFSIREKKVQRYYLSIILITIATSLAAPTITANRISVIFWILVSLIVSMNIAIPAKANVRGKINGIKNTI